MRFTDLPLGTRFCYASSGGKSSPRVFVKLGNEREGIVAEWNGWKGSAVLQGIFTFADSEIEKSGLSIEIAEAVEERRLLDVAIKAMATLHAAVTPIDEESVCIPASALREFVDAHARLLYDQHHLDDPKE